MTLVVDTAQSHEDLLNGQVALAHQTVYGAEVALFRVADTHVTDVCTQIADGLVGGLAAKIVGIVEIPQRGQIVAGKSVKHLADAGGIRVQTGGLNQQDDISLHCGRQQLTDNGHDALLVLVAEDVHAQTHVGDLQQACQMDAVACLCQHVFYRTLAYLNGNAGALEIRFVKGADELSAVAARVDALQQGSGLYLGVEQLNTLHFHIGGSLAGVTP